MMCDKYSQKTTSIGSTEKGLQPISVPKLGPLLIIV